MIDLKITENKVFLRHPVINDESEFTQLNSASREFHAGLVNPPIDRETFVEFIARNERPENECFLICGIEDEMIIGAINLSQIYRGGFQSAYLGYFLAEQFAGKNLMTQAIGLIVEFAFKDLNLHRLEANIQPQNLASIAVVRKNGFVKEGYSPKYLSIGGVWRDHERWAILNDGWTKTNE